MICITRSVFALCQWPFFYVAAVPGRASRAPILMLRGVLDFVRRYVAKSKATVNQCKVLSSRNGSTGGTRIVEHKQSRWAKGVSGFLLHTPATTDLSVA